MKRIIMNIIGLYLNLISISENIFMRNN